MKKVLLSISVLSLATGMIAKPEKGGKKPGSGEGRPSRQEVMKKFDKDGDGKLNDEERKAAMAARPKPGEGRKGKKSDGKGKENGKGKGKKKKES